MHQVHPVGQAGEFGDGRVVRKAYRPFFYAREHQEGAEGGEEDVGGAELPGPFEQRGLDHLAGYSLPPEGPQREQGSDQKAGGSDDEPLAAVPVKMDADVMGKDKVAEVARAIPER